MLQFPILGFRQRRIGRHRGEPRATESTVVGLILTPAVIPFADLQIGVTAVHLSCAIATRNVRHFRMIPNLAVKLF